MVQVYPATTQLRVIWEDATSDGCICDAEIAAISVLIARADDGVRLALSSLKGGADARRVREGREEFQRLHGPIDIEAYKNERRHCGNSDDAA